MWRTEFEKLADAFHSIPEWVEEHRVLRFQLQDSFRLRSGLLFEVEINFTGRSLGVACSVVDEVTTDCATFFATPLILLTRTLLRKVLRKAQMPVCATSRKQPQDGIQSIFGQRRHPRYQLKFLMAQMARNLVPTAEELEWLNAPPVGREIM